MCEREDLEHLLGTPEDHPLGILGVTAVAVSEPLTVEDFLALVDKIQREYAT